MDTLVQQIINGLVLGSMYALVALGYTMVYGIIGMIKVLSDKFVTLEIDDGVNMKVLRNHVSESANNLKEETKPAKA